ncbi:copper resistance protein NlpE [Lysobacter solisilvae (ex Woo and Kim 2020)]|uniref:Copper resistance protein NlpE N-terminal domain-containing protein n=1 Tax=Agrilutibacter terrestris TaxID=2865112 RepID=A0A7H0FWF2_9GAMM|nr:copper resistance protein NlpE [Lysobacter terrestris]QNP40368.1 copper resistance protein NlpE N-terminal domain-containing protein [Lysobacter terrestris]
MNRKLLLLAVLSTIAVAACKPEQPPAEAAMPAATAEPVAPVAVESAPAAAPADVPFDTKGFAGVFTGTLPCADCPGIDTRVALNRDGTYQIEETYQGKPERFSGDGTWTAEENGKRVRLDPNSKSQEDRLFAVASPEQIDQLDTAGNAIETTMPHSLKRSGAVTQ